MTKDRLEEIISRFPQKRIIVIGDFFLDKYLVLEDSLTEKSLETGLDAYQVVNKRVSPGAAGTVTDNLHALETGQIIAIGTIGPDGEGFELLSGLQARGVLTDHIIITGDRMTPTYTKPMLRREGVETEINRIDIKNREPLPEDIEDEIIKRLNALVPYIDAVIIADQVQERNCGIITDKVRGELSRLSNEFPDTPFLADSRTRINEFTDIWIKPNRHEVLQAMGYTGDENMPLEALAKFGHDLSTRNNRPLFITMAEDGILSVNNNIHHVPTLRQIGPLDICGAGDSTLASMTLALCSDATPEEAAVIGNIVASITVQQIGTTGTATREQILDRFATDGDQFQPKLINY
jgi:rfaE bifunctional protein kinase chain/domain